LTDLAESTTPPSIIPPRHRRVQPAARVSGQGLRRIRQDHNLNQEELANQLSVSKAYVQKLESSPASIPQIIAERLSVVEHKQMPASSAPPRHFHDFRRSGKFKTQQPPFERLPACACGNVACNLTPVAAGKWLTGILWWKFQGIQCRRISYLGQDGRRVLPPPRYAGDGAPVKKCSQCGRMQALAKKFSTRLGFDVYTRYCRRQKGDAKDQQHDPPTRFLLYRGRFVEVSERDQETLKGRSRREFSVPKCEVKSCPRRGKTMERSGVLKLTRTDGESVQIAVYRCRPLRPQKPHAVCRVLPGGEVAARVGFGRYSWIDGARVTRKTIPANLRPPNKGGRRATKTELYTKGMELRKAGRSWAEIATKLDPDGFSRNKKAASDRIRVGVAALLKKSSATAQS
jgi:DNA-binding transcriptional regulator YiaG